MYEHTYEYIQHFIVQSITVTMYVSLLFQELQKQREIAQLRKEDRRKESMIKELMADKERKDVVLKRRQEEVNIGSFVVLRAER